jgi:chromate reductase
MALAAAAEQLPLGRTRDIFDLADVPLYLQQCEDPRPGPIAWLKVARDASGGVPFETSQRNACIPVVLKSVIDWALRPMSDNSWARKVAGVIWASPQALEPTVRSRTFSRSWTYFDMVILGQPDMLISQAHRKFYPRGVRMHEKAKELLSLLARRLVALARTLKHGGGQ